MTISRQDLSDIDFVDAPELASDGTSQYVSLSVTSTDAGTSTVTVGLSPSSQGIRDGTDTPVEADDIVVITGTSGGLGDGTFTVLAVTGNQTFTVSQSIGTSTGGFASFRYPSGSKKVGFDPTRQTVTSATNVQQALHEEAIAFLLENEPVSGTTYSNTYFGGKVTSETWRNSSNSNLVKTINYTYSGNVLSSEVRRVYDPSGTNIVGQITATNTWSGSTLTGSTVVRDV